MKKLVGALLLLVSAFSCSAADYSAYVGLWQAEGSPPKTVEIARDGDSYLLADLRATDFSGKKQGPTLLSGVGPQLAFNTGAGAESLGLSADKNTLYFDKWTFKRIPAKDAEQVKRDINSAQSNQQANRAQCTALGKEYEAKGNEINRSTMAPKAKLASQADLKKNIVSRAGEDSGLQAHAHVLLTSPRTQVRTSRHGAGSCLCLTRRGEARSDAMPLACPKRALARDGFRPVPAD